MLFISYNLRLPYERNGSLGIAPTFLKFDSWLPGAGFIPIISIIEINQIKKGNYKKKIYYIFKNMSAIPCGCNSMSNERRFLTQFSFLYKKSRNQ